jgi:uncharacterized protein YkwD
MTNRRLRRALSVLPLALAISLPAAVATPGAAAAPGACAAANASPENAGRAQLEHTVLCLVNRERTSRGLSRLRSNGKLERAARGHSRHMVDAKFFAHDSPSGASVLERVKRRGYRSSGGMMVGENIAWGSGSYATPAEILNGWMNSPGHRANILNRRFREVGIGIALGAPEGSWDEAATYATEFGLRG